MSKTSYKKNPYVVRTVRYAYLKDGKWKHEETVSYVEDDQGAIEDVYKRILISWYPSFHVTEIIHKQW